MSAAARIGDTISHTSALRGLIAGIVVGAALAIAAVAIVGTGGVAAVAVGAGIASAAAGGGLAGSYIGEALQIVTGSITSLISMNVRIGGKFAAMAGIGASPCSGTIPLFPHGPIPIAQGSSTVFINSMMAARKGDKLVCGATISSGDKSVLIGGPTATVPGLEIEEEIPSIVKKVLWGVAIGGAIIATGGTVLQFGVAATVGGLVGGFGGGWLLGNVGASIGREIGENYGNPEFGSRLGEVFGGGLGGLAGGFVGGSLGSKTRNLFKDLRSIPKIVSEEPSVP